MLTLITGLPGSGKTLHMISELVHNPDLKGRPLYIDGIPNIDRDKIPYFDMPEGCTGENWNEWLPEEAILVVDEAQRYWRPRPNGSKVPDAVKEVEIHRKRGADLFFITQSPRLLDANIREFVQVHRHFSVNLAGKRVMLEWCGCGDPKSASSREDAITSDYSLDKKLYSYYKSAEVHTKIKMRVTKWVYILPALLLLIPVLTYFAYSYNKKVLTAQTTAPAVEHPTNAADGEAQAAPPDAGAGVYSPFGGVADGYNRNISAEDYIPALNGKPWTAPVYNGLNQQIKTMPFPVACIKESNSTKCTCYTEQATPIRNLDNGLCIDFAENGIYNPYREPKPEQTRQEPAALPAGSGGQVVSLGRSPKPNLLN